jgi:hypothetical protein
MSLARRSLQVVAFICTLVVGVASMAVIVTQTTWFKEWLRGFIVRQAEDYVNGRLSIGRLDGNLFFGVDLEDVDVTMNGKRVVDIKNIGLDYNAFTMLGGDVVLDAIKVDRPILRLEQTGQGWNLANLIKARTPDDPNAKKRGLEIGEIGIADGTLYVDSQPVGTSGIDIPQRIDRLDASVGVKTNEDELAIDITHVSLRAANPQIGLNSLSGVIRKTDTEIDFHNVAIRTEETSLNVNGSVKNLDSKTPIVSVKATSDKFAINELAKIVPALRGYDLQPAFEVTATGPADKLAVDLNAREKSVGNIIADITVDALGPERRVAGTANVQNLNVGPLAKSRTLKSDITGEARFDLALPSDRLPLSGTYAVNARHVQVTGYEARNVVADGRIDGQTITVDGKADAYGGNATVTGTVKTGQPLALDLKGRAAHLDLRNLPPQLKAPGVPSNLQFAYDITGRGQAFSGNVRLEQSTLAGATIAPGTTAQFSVGNGAPSYAATGEVSNLDVQQVGRGFGITALAADRYRSRVNASFDVKGSGGGRYPLTLDATGTVVESEMFGASFPRLDFTTNLAGGDAHVKATGQFANLDPAVVSGNQQVAGKITGSVDVDTTIRNYSGGVTPESIDATGHVDLQPSTVAGLQIDSAVVDGQFANREGNINQLSITGPDINVTGHGPIALNETGSSNLALHVETSSLERLGTLVNQPSLRGGAVMDAFVTGNAKELYVNGNLQGSGIGQGENNALSLESTFDVTLPELDPKQLTAHAYNEGTFVQIGGQKINRLIADATYHEPNLLFSVSAQQEQRQLDLGGSMVLHPDHQEIHLPDLAVRTQGIEWRTTPGSQATINYGKDRVQIDNLQLASGDQRIVANGVLGSESEALKVQADNVDVAQLNQLALGQPGQIGGRFTGNATISGPTSAPRVAADFNLTQGAFRMFKFESLGGKVDYAQRGVTMDVKLQQTPDAWLTAKGFAPITLFRANPPEMGHDHRSAEAGELVDIQVASSQVDLGVIQGFTSYVSNVTGTVQANFKVTGSGYDPHLDGGIEVRNGGFEVPDLGTSYTGLDTRIDLKPDTVHIAEMRILDNHGNPLTVGGDLAVHARSVGGVNVNVTSDNFKVIDNKMGNIRLNTDVRLTGEVLKPRVEGTIAVDTGVIDVAELLKQVATKAYSTEATELPFEDPQAAAAKVRSNAEIAADADATKPNRGADTAPNTTQVAKASTANVTAPTPEPPQTSVFDALALDVTVTVPDDLVLKGRDIRTGAGGTGLGDANITVGGDVKVTKNPGDTMRLLGDIRTIRGNYTFQGRRFDIMRDGRIRFIGAEQIDPTLDIEARRIISGVEAFVRVRGTMTQPELSFRSTPPLEEADILSLIVFNQPINELGEGQQVSLAQRAGDLAGGYLASGLARSIGNALNLNEFEIQAAGENGAGPSVMIGQQVGRNLFFRVRQGFGNVQATELTLEYQIKEYLRLQATAAETAGGMQRIQFRRVERGGLDLIFFFAY